MLLIPGRSPGLVGRGSSFPGPGKIHGPSLVRRTTGIGRSLPGPVDSARPAQPATIQAAHGPALLHDAATNSLAGTQGSR
jgi:hypothetical protein